MPVKWAETLVARNLVQFPLQLRRILESTNEIRKAKYYLLF